MTQDDKPEFVRLLSDVLAYYGKDNSKFLLNLWWTACQPFDFEQVSRALSRHATDPEHGQYAPKVADVVRILSGTSTDRANLAWGKAYEAMGSVGAYTDVVFDDPAIHAVIEDMGGWPKLCRGEIKDLSFLQHRFCEAYRAYVGRGTFSYARRLMGDRSPDHEYEKKGLSLPRPALIGDPERCKAVYEGGNLAGKTAISYHPLDLVPALTMKEAA